jgi:hypothetical protein
LNEFLGQAAFKEMIMSYIELTEKKCPEIAVLMYCKIKNDNKTIDSLIKVQEANLDQIRPQQLTSLDTKVFWEEPDYMMRDFEPCVLD